MGKTKNNDTTAISISETREMKVAPPPTAPVQLTQGRSVSPPAAHKPVSKQQRVAALLISDEGATLDQIIEETGWLPHTTRAALTGLKKKGYSISSDKVGPVRTYRAVSPE